MDLESIMARDPATYTAEEMAFLEAALCDAARELEAQVAELLQHVGDEEPDLTARLRAAVTNLRASVELAASLDDSDEA